MIKKTDRNHKEIIDKCRTLGLSVFSTHTIGKGFPDIVVGYKKKNYLIEIKDGEKSPSQRKLTKDEVIFFENWNGQVDIANNFDDVKKIIGI